MKWKNCFVNVRSDSKGIRESIFFNFSSERPPGFKICCEPEATQSEEKSKVFLKRIKLDLMMTTEKNCF